MPLLSNALNDLFSGALSFHQLAVSPPQLGDLFVNLCCFINFQFCQLAISLPHKLTHLFGGARWFVNPNRSSVLSAKSYKLYILCTASTDPISNKARKPMGNNLKLVLAEFSTTSQADLMMCMYLPVLMHAVIYC